MSCISTGEGPTIGANIPVGKTYTLAKWLDASAHLHKITHDIRFNGTLLSYDKANCTITLPSAGTVMRWQT